MKLNINKLGSKGSASIISVIVLLIILVVLIFLIVAKLGKSDSSGSSSSSGKVYCSITGKVCLTYPENWKLSYYGSSVEISNPSTQTTVVYKPGGVSSTVACSPGACIFTTLSAVISNGFSNGNDIAGVFNDTQTNSYVPEFFLMSTNQVLDYGIRLDYAVDIKQIVNPVFVNEAVANLSQQLKILPGINLSFNSLNNAKNWLHSSDAQQAEAIVNSARLN